MTPPRWMIVKYSRLWEEKGDKPFNLEECAKVMKEEKAVTAVILSNFRKVGWLIVQFDPKDARKRIYQLVHPEKMVEMMVINENAKNNPNKRKRNCCQRK